MTRQNRRRGRALLAAELAAILIALVAIALPAAGQSRTRSATPAEQDVVEAVDVAAGTIVLGGETYRVGTRSRLLDADGRPIGLSDLRDGRAGSDPDFVEFRASGSPKTIRSLQVVDADIE